MKNNLFSRDMTWKPSSLPSEDGVVKTDCIIGGQKKHYFVFMLIRLTTLVGTDKVQKKCSFRTRLVGLISTKKKEYFLAAIYAVGLLEVDLFK